MKSILSKIAVMSTIAMAMLFTSCGEKDTVESLTDEMITKFDALADAIGSAKDKGSAEKAAKEIDIIGDEMLAIVERIDALPDPSEDEEKKLEEKINKAVSEIEKNIGESMKGVISDPEVTKPIVEAMQRIDKKMQKAAKLFK